MGKAQRGPDHHLTMDEYQAFNLAADWPPEFADGRMWPKGFPDYQPGSMGGAPRTHTEIKSNTEAAFYVQSRGSRWHVANSQLQVLNETAGFAAFPDIVVYSEDAEFKEMGDLDGLLEPQVIIEILSEYSERFDLAEKYAYYRMFPFLSEYLAIDSRCRSVRLHERSGDHTWKVTFYSGPEDRILQPSIGCRLALSEIYAGVELPPPDSRWPRLVR